MAPAIVTIGALILLARRVNAPRFNETVLKTLKTQRVQPWKETNEKETEANFKPHSSARSFARCRCLWV